jgi:hypothetical protein
VLAGLAPLAGTAAFLAVSLPRTAQKIMHLEHYDGGTAVEAFHPLQGLVYTGRSVVDNLLCGVLGFGTVHCPVGLVPVVLLAVAALGVWWWWRAPCRRLLLLGLGMVGSSYLLVYSARAEWGYDNRMNLPNWTRYHLLPQLGLTLFVAGGLRLRVPVFRVLRVWPLRLVFPLGSRGGHQPAKGGHIADRPRTAAGGAGPGGEEPEVGPTAGVTCRQAVGYVVLVAALFAIQLPRGILYTLQPEPGQAEALRRIEAVDAVCREHHISAETARQVLGRLQIPAADSRENGWDFLRGSDDPRPIDPADARRLLAPAGQ